MEFACFQRDIIISVGWEAGGSMVKFFRGINIFRRCTWLNFSMGVTFFRRTEIFKGGGVRIYSKGEVLLALDTSKGEGKICAHPPP